MLFSTLWSKISPPNEWLLERNMSDFQVIRNDAYPLSAQRFNQLHEESLVFLSAELAAPGTHNTAVVTHHVPTFMHYPETYKDSLLNEAFAMELSGLIADTRPCCWIYSHHHCNTPAFLLPGSSSSSSRNTGRFP
jgi:hypothetical protein